LHHDPGPGPGLIVIPVEQTYRDAEAMLKISDEIHCLLKQNTELTEGINRVVRGEKTG
jgi:hypothetical protein